MPGSPGKPCMPVRPIEPSAPDSPRNPCNPALPCAPAKPCRPRGPCRPCSPCRPSNPVSPRSPRGPTAPRDPVSPFRGSIRNAAIRAPSRRMKAALNMPFILHHRGIASPVGWANPAAGLTKERPGLLRCACWRGAAQDSLPVYRTAQPFGYPTGIAPLGSMIRAFGLRYETPAIVDGCPAAAIFAIHG